MSKLDRALKIQEEIEGNTEDLREVHKIIKELKDLNDGHVWSEQFNVLVDTKFHRYGEYSYQTHKFYCPSKLYKRLKGKEI